jgi:Mn-dependent DtxR family transcriptional regulator
VITSSSNRSAKGLQSRAAKRTRQKAGISNRLEVIRNAHSMKKYDDRTTGRMEDYLEVIYELVRHKGYATSIDMAECLNISQPSVTKMMRRLDASGLIDYQKYRGVRLTERGIDIAKAIHERHGILSEFLSMIGVDEDIAKRDAEEIEHHVHPETLTKLQQLLQHLKMVKSS